MILYNISVYIYIYVYIKNPRRFPKWWKPRNSGMVQGAKLVSLGVPRKLGKLVWSQQLWNMISNKTGPIVTIAGVVLSQCLGSVSPQVGDMSPFILHCGYNRDRSRPIVPCFGLDEDP